jgi:hypothetical protein
MRILVATAVLAFASPLSARVTFAQYDGPNAERVGGGGTRITKNGVDWWTAGSPSRRYRVLGVITDTRSNKPFRGQALGSKSIAKQVKNAGGDAVILMGQDRQIAGSNAVGGIAGSGGGYNGWMSGKVITDTTSQLLVVKYL